MNISFIVAAFNCADTLTLAIESIYNDNFQKGDEVIIIDDASTDETYDIASQLQSRFNSIIIQRHKINKGSAAAARNTGIDAARNDLIFCLDADNILVSNTIPKLKDYLYQQNADAVAFREIHYFKDNPNTIESSWQLLPEIKFFDNINNARNCPCSSGNYLFTKESWLKAGRYIESVGGAYDSWAFGCNQLATGAKMLTLEDTYYLHKLGYESTFVKEKRKYNTSLTITKILLNHLHLLQKKDINYILSKKHRYSWWENLKNRPLNSKSVLDIFN